MFDSLIIAEPNLINLNNIQPLPLAIICTSMGFNRLCSNLNEIVPNKYLTFLTFMLNFSSHTQIFNRSSNQKIGKIRKHDLALPKFHWALPKALNHLINYFSWPVWQLISNQRFKMIYLLHFLFQTFYVIFKDLIIHIFTMTEPQC